MARTGKYARPTVSAWDAKRAQAKAKATQAGLGDAVETAADAEDDTVLEGYEEFTKDDTVLEGYEEFTKDELTLELKSRGIPHTGTKDELINRLYDDDEFGLRG